MIATKCDICGHYVDKDPAYIPHIDLGYIDISRPIRKNICFECYDKILDMFHEDNEDKK